jgi:hypothetical protein
MSPPRSIGKNCTPSRRKPCLVQQQVLFAALAQRINVRMLAEEQVILGQDLFLFRHLAVSDLPVDGGLEELGLVLPRGGVVDQAEVLERGMSPS